MNHEDRHSQESPRSLMRSIIEDSRKSRINKEEKTRDLVGTPNLKVERVTVETENIKQIRETHLKLLDVTTRHSKSLADRDKNTSIKQRSKSIHIYVNDKIESFLKEESEKTDTKWGLRKNAGLGQLIQKFIYNYIELKKREERQVSKIKKIVNDFKLNLIEFKKLSGDLNNYKATKTVNQKLRSSSNDLNIVLSLFEFDEKSLKSCLGTDSYDWVEFILKWKFHS